MGAVVLGQPGNDHPGLFSAGAPVQSLLIIPPSLSVSFRGLGESVSRSFVSV